MDNLELETVCDYCNGDGGSIDDYGDAYSCAACNGSGYVPTEFGEKVLALMRHNFRPLYQWMIESK